MGPASPYCEWGAHVRRHMAFNIPSAFDREYRPDTNARLADQQRARRMSVSPEQDAWWDTVTKSLEPFCRGQTSVLAATSNACSDGVLHLPRP